MARHANLGDLIRAKLQADPRLADAVERQAFRADVGEKVYNARSRAGLTQKQLAARVGTQQSVISRIEDADYGRPSLRTLERIAEALDLDLRIVFAPKPGPSSDRRKLAGKA